MYLQHSLQQLLLDAQHRTVLYARAELASARSMSPCIYMEGFGNHIEWYTLAYLDLKHLKLHVT